MTLLTVNYFLVIIAVSYCMLVLRISVWKSQAMVDWVRLKMMMQTRIDLSTRTQLRFIRWCMSSYYYWLCVDSSPIIYLVCTLCVYHHQHHSFRMILEFFQIKYRNLLCYIIYIRLWILLHAALLFLYLTEPYAHNCPAVMFVVLHYTICVIARCVSG